MATEVGKADAVEDQGANPGASVPRLVPINYDGRNTTISGDPDTVARIHRTDRAFDLFETMTLAALASVATAMSALMVMYAPEGREFLVLGLSATGWILALGLSGYTAIRIKASRSGFDISGQHEVAKPTGKAASAKPPKGQKPAGA